MSWKEKLKFGSKLLFYLSLVGYSIPTYLEMSKGLYKNYLATSIIFNLDTLFLNWNTSFPAITVCELYNGEKLWDLGEKLFGIEHDLRLDDVMGELVYFQGSCTSCEMCGSENITCPTNFTQLLNMSNIEYINNREAGAGYLNFEVSADIQLFLHSPLEIPFLTADGMIRETVLQGRNKEIIVNAMEVYNHASLSSISMEDRQCRFTGELTELGKYLDLYKFYSFSTCIVECSFSIHLKLCNCSSHFLAKPESPNYEMCDYEGLSCLTDYFYDILEERRKCDCMNTCEEPEYNIIYNSPDEKKGTDVSKVRVALSELPTMRYVRKVSKTKLDLLISLGGLVGLFFNASLIRVVELIFIVLDYNWKSIKRCFA